MGTWANGTCFPDKNAAAAAICSGTHGVSDAGVTRCDGVASVGPYWGSIWLNTTSVDGLTESTLEYAVPLVSCDVTTSPNFPFDLSASDGALIAAAIVGVWMLGWGFKALALTLRNDGEALD